MVTYCNPQYQGRDKSTKIITALLCCCELQKSVLHLHVFQSVHTVVVFVVKVKTL